MSEKAGITVRQARTAYKAFNGKMVSKAVYTSKGGGKAKVIKEQVIKTVEVVKKVPFIVTKPVIKEVKVIKEVPVVHTKEILVVKEVKVPFVKIKEVIKKVPVEKIVIKQDEKAMKALNARISKLEIDLANARKRLKLKPKTVIKEVEVIKEVPIEIIKEVEVVKTLDFAALQKMMKGVKTVEVSKKVVGESRTKGESTVVERREIKEGDKRTVVSKSKSSSSKTTSSKGTKDDLTKVEGIGPAIAKLLNAAGVHTFQELANMKISAIQDILTKAGPKFQMHSPGSWPKQADLAANGKWEQLEKLQDVLSGGK